MSWKTPIIDGLMPDVAVAREALLDLLRKDLLGPHEALEEFEGRPESRYIVGVLHPAFSEQNPEESDEALAGADDEESSDAYAAYGGLKQSAIGLSFSTGPQAAPIVTVEFAEYVRPDSGEVEDESEGDEDDPAAGESAAASTARVKRVWKREAIRIPQLTLDSPRAARLVANDIELRWQSRFSGPDRVWTVSLVNRRSGKRARPIFQPKLTISNRDAEGFRARPSASHSDPDEQLSALLYRTRPEYAVGHGCAADWNASRAPVTQINTELLPAYEVPAVVPEEQTAALLVQGTLADIADAARLKEALLPIVDEYRKWITQQATRVDELDVALRPTAKVNLDKCRAAALRIAAGIELLVADAQVHMAFRFMNAAMDLQRRRSLAAAAYRATGQWPATESEVPAWRPFQLAFILMNLAGVSQSESSDRSLVDLLWFPTGGGKTEAYLGLTAFAIGYRRLAEQAGRSTGQGITVLMRYTLRLLTTQQFERATTLITACEVLRRAKPQMWGTEPITIGLWVGKSATPNHYDAAKERRDELGGDANASERHPFVLRTCPWCGSKLPFPASFVFNDASHEVTVSCPSGRCEFAEPRSLPVILIDETAYRHPPSVLLATVDKFARMPWVGDAASLFGRATSRCPTHGYVGDITQHKAFCDADAKLESCAEGPGISLIIQDELHLISGPLGTLVGLYEIAVDFLGGRGKAVPKVIASTATIRSADDQVRALYGRDTSLFPPPALDPFESFFARIASADERPGRRFIGLAAPGSSMKTALIRVYASLLSGTFGLTGDDTVRDPYWTLIGYFNSLRELGGAVSLMHDDVPKRVNALSRQDLRPRRELTRIEELTSRIPTYEIPNRLRQMEEQLKSGRALDALLATNMISAGIDVDRLGLMVVAGQPKGTAEYIQATSRVGRRHPGLIVTVYNWTRPRDLSHYERFRSYHSALYRHVEATSVTPLAPRARDRGLQAVLVSVVRLAEVRLRGDRGASVMSSGARAEPLVAEFLQFFAERARRTQSSEADAALLDVEGDLDYWESRAKLAPQLTYERHGVPPMHLIRPAADEPDQPTAAQYDSQAWRLPNSLRNVEREHNWFRR
jgi:hypothetical protein